MTVDRLLELASAINPGFFLIAASVWAAFAKGGTARAIGLLGGPALALLALLYPPASGTEVARAHFLGFDLALYRPDSLSLIFGFGFVLAAALAGVYSLHREDRLQDAAGLLYAGAAMAAVFAGDLISLVVFWELTALASTVLIFARATRASQAAGMRYFVIQTISGLLLMAGVAIYGLSKGSFILSDLGPLRGGVLTGVLDVHAPGGLLILVGVGVKAAFPLFHNWLTDAYPNTTETGAVVMSAYTTTLAVYVLARGFAGLDWLIWIGAAMTIYPVFFAVMENDLRKVLAYSTNNQIGFMVCAVGIGTPLAVNGAAAHALAHIVFKGLLFMAMGAVWMRTGTTKATELGGLHRTMPFTTLFCLVGAASISALPFFAGFSSKSMIMAAAHGPGLTVVWLMLLFASAGVLEHSGIKIPFFAFFSHDSGKRPKEAPFTMLLAMGLASALCLAIGLLPGRFYELLPYRDEALLYLAQDLFSGEHILTQMQLLAFAVLAFVVLRRLRLYPPERRGVILDVEWLWRKAGRLAGQAIVRQAGRATVAVERTTGLAVARVLGGASQVFAPDRWTARNLSLAGSAIWTLGLLGFVAILAIFASYR
jgi:multicomponent Na+:H+ antiporter subunit D